MSILNPYTLRPPRPQMLHRGQPVHLNARTRWLPATVLTVAHTTIGVRLHIAAPAPTRLVPPWLVRPADGYRLAAVAQLCRGDQVAAADGTLHTVDAPPERSRGGWWLVTYLDGQRATLPPGTVLRLADPTRPVSVNGVALPESGGPVPPAGGSGTGTTP